MAFPLISTIRRAFVRDPVIPIFFIFLTLYVFSAGGHFYNPDEILSYSTTQAIAEKGSLNIAFAQPLVQSFGGTLKGHIYSQHGLLEPLLALPFFLLGTVLHVEEWRVVTLLYSPIITSTSVCLVYLISRRLGRSATLSASLSLLYGTATLAWPYSKFFFELPTASLMLLVAVYFLLDPIQRKHSAVLSGFFTTLSVFAAVTQILALPCFLAYVILKPYAKSRQRLVTTVIFLSPIVIGGLVYAYLNVVRFGSALSFGYGALSSVTSEAAYGTNPLVGIFGLLFSSGEGAFIYYPLCALGLFTLFINRRDNNWARFMFVWIFLANLLFYSRYNYWDGWWAWGARYLVPTMPYLILGVGPFIESARHSIMRIIVIISATAVGIFSNLMGVLINFDFVMDYLGGIGAFNAAPKMGVFPRFYPGIWMPEFSQVRGSWDLLWSPILSDPAKYFTYASSMSYLNTRLDLFLYYWLGTPVLALTLLLLLVEACWLVRSLKRINKNYEVPSFMTSGDERNKSADASIKNHTNQHRARDMKSRYPLKKSRP